MIISGIVVLIIAVAVGIFMSTGKAEDSKEDIDMKEPTTIEIEQKVEYGDDIKDETFTIHMEDETREANFVDLDPEVDTMTVGNTEHKLELEDIIFDVTVVIEDTQKPVIKGVKDSIEFEDLAADKIEEELSKLITASDPVDGDLEVTFTINPIEDKENEYDVTVEAEDKNGNKTTEKFKVVVKIAEKEKKEEKDEKKDEEDKPSSVASKSEEDPKPKQEEPKQEKPKQEEPKQETPKQKEPEQEKPKQEEPKQQEPKQEKPQQEEPEEEEYQCGVVTGKIGGSPPNFPPLNDPKGSLPSGASIINKSKSYHEYSYTRSLPGGGSITEVAASYEYCEHSVIMLGQDNNGDSFISSYLIDRDTVMHTVMGSPPKFTEDDIRILYEVGRAFAKAYGMK